MARRPNPALHALWRDRVSRQSRSGLSVEQFCAQEPCARSAFYRWRRQLDLVLPSDQCPALPAPSTFLPVTVRLVEKRCPPVSPDRGRPPQWSSPPYPHRQSSTGVPPRSPSLVPGPIPEAHNDQPPSSRPGVLPHPTDRSPQGLRRTRRLGDHRLRPGSHVRTLVPVRESPSRPPQNSLLGPRWFGRLGARSKCKTTPILSPLQESTDAPIIALSGLLCSRNGFKTITNWSKEVTHVTRHHSHRAPLRPSSGGWSSSNSGVS